MLLASITGAGWLFIVVVLLGAVLTRGVVRRLAPDKPGCVTYGMVGAATMAVLGFVFGLSAFIGSNLVGLARKPRYEATVVSYTSHMSTTTETVNGQTRTRNVTMYTPIVKFTAESGASREIATDMASSGAPDIGDRLTVAVGPDDLVAQDLSGTKVGLLAGAALLLFMTGLVLVGAVQYARGADIRALVSLGLGFIMKVVFPTALLFMIGGMGRALWQFFSGERPDMPIWAVVVCGFLCLVLLACMPGLLRLAFTSEPPVTTTTPPPGA